MRTIKIKDPELNQTAIAQQLRDALAQMPPLSNLAQSGPASLHRTITPRQSDAALPDFSRDLIELVDNAVLQETEFSSNAPGIGPLIVKFRQLWNWMSTRWYVLPVMRQQSDLNMQTALLLLEITQIQEQSARHIAKLEQRVNILEAELTRQEADTP